MSYTLQVMILLIQEQWDYLGDPDMKGFRLLSTPWPMLLLTALYLMVVGLTKKFMKARREAFEIQFVLDFYHLVLKLGGLVYLINLQLLGGWNGYNR